MRPLNAILKLPRSLLPNQCQHKKLKNYKEGKVQVFNKEYYMFSLCENQNPYYSEKFQLFQNRFASFKRVQQGDVTIQNVVH